MLHKHYATHLHYDFRIEFNRVLKSWALPKGLPKTIKTKRLAVETEDHSLNYATFEGVIPEGQYGAGKVLIWDDGTYINLKKDAYGHEVSLKECFKQGHLEIWLFGRRFYGAYAIIKFREKNWLFIKMDLDKLLKKWQKTRFLKKRE